MSFISYASNFEDILLNRVFHDQQIGFYIDIGAAHPVYSSTTKSFYDRGWHGINVEPGPSINLLKDQRTRDINIQAAITDYDGEITFHVNELEMTSSIFEELDPSIAARTKRLESVVVPAMTMSTLVEKYLDHQNIDFLKIDAEGAEASIILSTNWNVIQPRIIVAESTKPYSTERIDVEWKAYLENNGYIESYFDGINTWYVRVENPNDLKYFNCPVNVLDDFVRYDPAIHDNQNTSKETKAKKHSRGKKIFKKLRKMAKKIRPSPAAN